MYELFGRDQSVISRHIRNVFKEGELPEESNMQKMHIAGSDKPVSRYSLDVIVSVGYRVKSQRGVQFRQWATQVLKDHLVQGYTLNRRCLAEWGIEFEQAMNLLSRTLSNQGLMSPQGAAVAGVISDYARSWSLLQDYDEQQLAEIGIKQPDMRPLELDEALAAIGELKQILIAKGEATELFGWVRGDGLASALATIEQGFGDELFYPNVASRGAHLLYFVIKNHPLADGNKRLLSAILTNTRAVSWAMCPRWRHRNIPPSCCWSRWAEAWLLSATLRIYLTERAAVADSFVILEPVNHWLVPYISASVAKPAKATF
ncbi:RhuM family protein [Zobellella sp. DQSA1]|uniref:RhuM family protein n=1 Tax=Zobellella sp. DQSA1 TaxID=3342386 RepID=UPI0035BFC15D